MEKPLSLSLLYSANLRGDIALLPQLFTFMQRLKPGEGPGSLIVDLGKACDDAAPHCRQTGGRSMLIALDGMGYHAANIEGALDPRDRGRVDEQVTMALVDSANDWRYRLSPLDNASIRLTLRPNSAPARLQICLAPAERTRMDGNVLFLRDVCAGQVGAVSVDLRPSPRLTDSAIHDLPPDTPPNASIAGAIEFIESEARLFHSRSASNRRKNI
ncbi:MAG: hypothetical protein OXG60_06915 [Chloroflexi bacterium]|nr:hypothetical protein [Chloroflexota bacterium]